MVHVRHAPPGSGKREAGPDKGYVCLDASHRDWTRYSGTTSSHPLGQARNQTAVSEKRWKS